MPNVTRRACSAGLAGLAAAALTFDPIAALAESRRPARCATYGLPADRFALLARGFNLTGWLSGDDPRRPDLALLARLRARGFTHIRLPVAAERLLDTFSSRQNMSRQLAELDFALAELIQIGFGVSLDLHPAGPLSRLHAADPEAGYRLIATLWQQLAQRYRGLPAARLFLEVLNEPSVPEKIWNDQGSRLVEVIRRTAPEHTIVYGPANDQQIGALFGLQPLADPNVVYAVHFYEPMIFTHQGLDWSDDPVRHLRGVPFPAGGSDPAVVRLARTLDAQGRKESLALLQSQLEAPWTEDRIARLIARAAEWSLRERRPVILNEFGVLGWKAAPADRARWIAAVRRAAEAHCLGWAHWDYADGFGFVRRIAGQEIPDESIVGALLNASAPARRY
jgi:endoglucanase